MIRSVDFISRLKAESLPARNDLAVISITEPEADPAALAFHEDVILRLVFHDVDPGAETETRWTLFDPSHADQVIRFVRRLHADSEYLDLIIHCRAGISRSAALALFVAADTGCEFPRRPFAGLANKHMLIVLEQMTGTSLPRPRALPKRESFSVSVVRDFHTDEAEVTVENIRTGETVVVDGPMLFAAAFAAAGIQKVWGVLNPPPSYHVQDWDNLT
ncbi:hypothetical protein [Sulfuritalea hydrogenivorans]|uniref:Tyrosine specific protein phosphatases domain-containing protein n=1 Tax=Sulfuritalea hydrogenivorans sk43H TaxID=1223802 RepID=W0SC44_9PROT|nr:hypothetical protein [Sulfuritalea hydrogenivorans]BAO28300.1 hypothetical protein SUTH_00486 [Sulfuritalea hydrogenivorans sk43H]